MLLIVPALLIFSVSNSPPHRPTKPCIRSSLPTLCLPFPHQPHLLLLSCPSGFTFHLRQNPRRRPSERKSGLCLRFIPSRPLTFEIGRGPFRRRRPRRSFLHHPTSCRRFIPLADPELTSPNPRPRRPSLQLDSRPRRLRVITSTPPSPTLSNQPGLLSIGLLLPPTLQLPTRAHSLLANP